MTSYFIVCANGKSLEVCKEEYLFCREKNKDCKIDRYHCDIGIIVVEHYRDVITDSGKRREVVCYKLVT